MEEVSWPCTYIYAFDLFYVLWKIWHEKWLIVNLLFWLWHTWPVLAAWFRLKYPHVALGALASSAPILYFDDITPQNGYYSVVTKDFRVIINQNFQIFILYFFPFFKYLSNYSAAFAGSKWNLLRNHTKVMVRNWWSCFSAWWSCNPQQ